MKRKLCLALALAMVLSMFASLSAFAWNTFNPEATPTIAVRVDDYTESAADFGLPAGTPVYGITPTIANNEGFMSMELGIHFNATKIKLFAGDYALPPTAANGIGGADGKTWVEQSTMTVDGVLTNYKISNFGKSSFSIGQGIKYNNSLEDCIIMTTCSGTAYSMGNGDMITFIMVPVDGYTPVATDFPVQLDLLAGTNKQTEDLTARTIVVNPYVPGGSATTKDITVTYGEGGSVEVGGVAVASPYVATVGEDETISANIVPATGYYCSSYVLDGTTIDNAEVGTISNITVSESLVVTFTAVPAEPVIGNEVKVGDTHYAAIDNFENIGEKDYGFKITVTRKVVNGLVIERDNEVYYCSCKGKAGANSLGQYGAIIEILNAEECDYTVEAYVA